MDSFKSVKKLALAFALFGFQSQAAVREKGAVTQSEDGFNFTLYTTEVQRWANKERTGLVTDSIGPAADGVLSILNQASQTLNMAIYGVQKESWFFRALRRVQSRKVKVQTVIDQETAKHGPWDPRNFTYSDTVLLKKLLPANALVVDQDLAGEPRASTIMHNKFLIADGRWLWTGSTNISHTCLGAEYNANASIVVDSPELTALYEAEFRQMFEDFRFSIYKEELEHRPTIRYRDGTEVSVFFSPQDNAVVEGVVPFLNQARKSIDIAMFYLTHVDVVDALGQAVERGVKVRIIADAVGAAHPSSKVNLLRSLGVEVKVENWGGKMHMKAAIADGSHVIIGSMNWTEAGNTKNDENTMVIRKNKRVASELGGYFDSLWSTLKVVRTDARAESWQSINSCIDGIDNDHDGQTDQKDGACQQ